MLAQSEINIAIGEKPPERYFKELVEQFHGGKKKYGGITKATDMPANLRMHCLPESLLDGETPGLRRLCRSAPQAHGDEDQELVRGGVMTADLRRI